MIVRGEVSELHRSARQASKAESIFDLPYSTIQSRHMDTPDYTNEYSEGSLWEKLGKFALSAGREVVEKVLVLFEALKDPDTPTWAKGVIVAAIGYFIAPVDAIPDLVPLAGYADDLGAISAALAAVALHIKKQHFDEAKRKVSRWFDKSASASE